MGRDLGIDPAKYDFKPLPDLLAEIQEKSEVLSAASVGLPPVHEWRERVERVKAGLAAELGLDPSAIEITVRV